MYCPKPFNSLSQAEGAKCGHAASKLAPADVPSGPVGLQSAGTKHVALTAQNCTFQFTFLKQKVPNVKLSSCQWPMLASKCPSSHNTLPKTAPRHFSHADALLRNYTILHVGVQPHQAPCATQKCNAQFTSSSSTKTVPGRMQCPKLCTCSPVNFTFLNQMRRKIATSFGPVSF